MALVDCSRPSLSLVGMIFRYFSTCDAMKLDLGLASSLSSFDGIIISIVVFIKHIDVLAVFVTLLGGDHRNGCHCPARRVAVGWFITGGLSRTNC